MKQRQNQGRRLGFLFFSGVFALGLLVAVPAVAEPDIEGFPGHPDGGELDQKRSEWQDAFGELTERVKVSSSETYVSRHINDDRLSGEIVVLEWSPEIEKVAAGVPGVTITVQPEALGSIERDARSRIVSDLVSTVMPEGSQYIVIVDHERDATLVFTDAVDAETLRAGLERASTGVSIPGGLPHEVEVSGTAADAQELHGG